MVMMDHVRLKIIFQHSFLIVHENMVLDMNNQQEYFLMNLLLFEIFD